MTQTTVTRTPTIRLAGAADIEAMHRVRLSVRENCLIDEGRVTPADYRLLLEKHGRGWVCEEEGEILGFGIADDTRRNIWALFVTPGCEHRGIGRALHDRMVSWLFERGGDTLWLTTEPDTRAEAFYFAAGWQRAGTEPSGETRFELGHARAASQPEKDRSSSTCR